MKKTLSTNEIADLLIADENANWTRAGAFALAEYLEDYEDSTGEETELDVVALRCEFSEYESLQEWAKDYHGTQERIKMCEAMGINEEMTMPDPGEDFDDEIDEVIRQHIQDNGTLIEFSGGIIVSSF